MKKIKGHDRVGYQQGDVLVFQVAAIPEDAKPVEPKSGRHILAEGEHTGHAHAILDSPKVQVLERNGTFYLRVEEESVLTHEEHNAQTIAPGLYEVGIVKEVDPFTEEVRSVMD